MSKKQMMDIHASAGMTIGQSNEHLRNWTRNGWSNALSKGNYDKSRNGLNFEITKGGVVTPVNTKKSIPQRIKEILKERGIEDPNETKVKRTGEAKKRQYRTVVNIIFGGNRERMHELAFGDQKVDISRRSDNSHITRKQGIEEWAKDMYRFACEQWGEENVAAFVVHLDELNPHIHCTVLPINPETKRFDFKHFFGGKSKYELSQRTLELHDRLAEYNKKWGLERGSSVAMTGARHRSTEEYRRELSETNTRLEKMINEKNLTLGTLLYEIAKAQKKIKSLTTMIENLESKKGSLNMEINELKNRIEELRTSSDVNLFELEKQLSKKEWELRNVESKISDKTDKLTAAEKDLQLLRSKEDMLQERLDSIRNDIANSAELEARQNMSAVAAAAYTEVLKNFSSVYKDLSPEEAKRFEGTLIEDMNKASGEILKCAALMFMGMGQAAIVYSEECGGGGVQNDIPWRDPDENERQFARRCFLAAHSMLKPSRRRGRKK